MFLRRFSSLLFVLILSFGGAFSQLWVEMMHDPNANFYDIQQEFNNYWENRPIEKGKGWKQFKRWEEYMEPRVYPTGNRALASSAYENFRQWENDLQAQGVSRSLNGNWTSIGPVGKPNGGGAGRINFIRFDPSNSNILWVGAPNGGLWKSSNGGASWTTNTDQLTVIGCSDVAIHPTNSQIMYLATGDGDASDSYSVGVLKSTDGGNTWNSTGLDWTVNQLRTLSRVLINPNNPDIVMAFGNAGIFRTTDAGANWTQVVSGLGFKDAEFKPGDPNIVYASGASLRRSTDGGVTWTNIPTGLTGVSRMAIAVTPANPNYVYILAANGADNGFLALIRSTDSGASFSTRTTTPNILGWDNGGDSGGQGWYDLAIAASPTNAEEIITGGVNQWRSTNGGTTFTLQTHWYGGYSRPYVHADIHDIVYLPGSGTTIYSGNDGGVFRTTNGGTSWTDISNNLTIAQQYRMGQSSTNASLIIAGHQDNGSNVLNGTTWTQRVGGDGMDCFVDKFGNNLMIASLYYGDYRRSTNGGNSFSNMTNPSVEGTWVSPIRQDPVTAARVYAAGRPNLFKTDNILAGSVSWTQLGAPTGSGSIREFAVAPSNNQIIYALKSSTNAVSKSTNGGTSFSSISTGLTTSATPTWVAVSNTNPDVAFVTYSGYSAANKVFKTVNGGASWTNISAGLPNVPVNCVVYVENSPGDAIYIGTDVGVFYTDNSVTGWIDFSADLPRTSVRDLQIFYPTGKIRAATYGRSMWESDLFSLIGDWPTADFTADRTAVCPGGVVQFTDLSNPAATSWSWTFAGGTPGTSSAQNPLITYPTSGTYQVSLTATNADGQTTAVKTDYITVTAPATLPLVEGFEDGQFAPNGWFVQNHGTSSSWTRNSTIGAYGTSSGSAIFDNFSNNENGARDRLVTIPFNTTGLSTVVLTFDVAYARQSASLSDSLAVFVSTDCGVSYTQVYLKGGTTLATNGGGNVTSLFVPANGEWRNESVNLDAFAGNGQVLVAFENRGRHGNVLYLDNINIAGAVAGEPPVAAFTTLKTTICEGETITFNDLSTNLPGSWNWTFPGGTPASSTQQNPIITYSTPGVYSVTLSSSNGNGSDLITLTNFIEVIAYPIATPTSNSPVCETQAISLNVNNIPGANYTWTGPAGFVSSVEDPVRINATTGMAGNYNVVIDAFGCIGSGAVAVVVNTNPSAAASSNSPVCAGTDVFLNSNFVAGATYSWTGPNGFSAATQSTTVSSVTSANAGIYTLGITFNGCTGTSIVSVAVNTVPTPTIHASGDTLYVTPGTGYTIQWYSGGVAIPGATSNWFYPGVDGNYSVVLTNITSCTSTSAPYNFVFSSTNELNKFGFSIYPNPGDGLFILRTDQPTGEAFQIEVYNQLGSVIHTQKVASNSGTINIDLTAFAAGLYYVKIITRTFETNAKLVKN